MLNPSRKALNAADVPFILLSGGIDSTALLSHLVLEEELRPRGIFLDVGQRSAARQLAAVKKLSLRYNIAVDTPVEAYASASGSAISGGPASGMV